MQRNAFNLLLELRRYVEALEDPDLLRFWRLLTISDHFYYMATKFGSFDEVHKYFSPYKNAVDAYTLFVQALSVLSYAVAERVRENPLKVARRLSVPAERGFHFRCPETGVPTLTATSVKELLWVVRTVPGECLAYHLARGDIQRWLRDVLFLDKLAEEVNRVAKLEGSIEEKSVLLAGALERYVG